jgi:DNA-binding response OmpR family regulator
MPKILIVEDDPAMLSVIERTLSREGMETEALENGAEALELLQSAAPFDLMILDVMLPGMDGITLCREIRAGTTAHKEVPIVMLTARSDETSIVVGLEVGADDYVTKPFSPRQLVSRVRAHLRRQQINSRLGAPQQQKVVFPGLELDLIRRQVTANGRPVTLTAKEFEVLAFLSAHPGRVYSREQIMRHLWGGEFFGDARAADVHVQHLRKKLEPDPKNPRYIQTVRGFGYKFAEL